MHTTGDYSIADLAELFNIVQAGSRQAPRSRSGAGSCQGKVQMSGVVLSLASALHRSCNKRLSRFVRSVASLP